MTLIVLLFSALLVAQNSIQIGFGFKELAIVSFPLAFVGPLLTGLLGLWVAAAVIRRSALEHEAVALTCVGLTIVAATEIFLFPVGLFTVRLEAWRKDRKLGGVEVVASRAEAIRSDGANGILLRYSLEFPETDTFLTFPAFVEGDSGRKIFGNYLDGEASNRQTSFTAHAPNEFVVFFPDAARSGIAHVQICTQKRGYDLRCRDVPVRFDASADLSARGMELSSLDSPAALAERFLRIVEIEPAGARIHRGDPLQLRFAITNTGDRAIRVPSRSPQELFGVYYGIEPLSDSAKKMDPVVTGVAKTDDAFFLRVVDSGVLPQFEILAPGETIEVTDELRERFSNPPLPAGDYRLHVFLTGRYGLVVKQSPTGTQYTQDASVPITIGP